MGEKPLSIDEAPVPTATVGGVARGGGVDAPPPGMVAGSINTTRSNIKSSGAVATAGDAGASADRWVILPGERAAPPIDGVGGAGTEEAPPPDMSGAASVVTTRSNIPSSRSVATADDAGTAADRPPPIDSDADVAVEGEPIPGLDMKLGRNPVSGAATVGPVKPEPTRPADPTPTHGGSAGIAIKEQGIKYGEDGGDALATGDAPQVAGAGKPIPGVEIVIKKNA
jgi:hypothetical protein